MKIRPIIVKPVGPRLVPNVRVVKPALTVTKPPRDK